MSPLFSKIEEPKPPPDEESRAVVACDGKGAGVVLWCQGQQLEYEIEACSNVLSDIGLDDAPAGISVWIGMYVWFPGGFEHPEDGDSVAQGKFRPPTDEEWVHIRAGRSPWSGDT